ncbi:MAG: phosphoribosylglycinamide formyltransferase [Agarilytica sp.]
MNAQKQSPARVVVLISGGGTNLQALIDGQENGVLPVEICAIISNKDGVRGIERAEKHNIPAIVLDHKLFASREAFDLRLQEIIDTLEPDIVVLAGFMRILTPEFTAHFEGKMINIHPSLLPKYQGLHTHQRAIDAEDTEHGATVHFVTAELDGGPPIIQARVPIFEGDTADTLAARVLEKEHKIFPLAVRWIAEKKIEMREKSSFLNGEKLPATGFIYIDEES